MDTLVYGFRTRSLHLLISIDVQIDSINCGRIAYDVKEITHV